MKTSVTSLKILSQSVVVTQIIKFIEKKLGNNMVEVLSKNLSKIKVPLGEEKIYKDECIFSFDNPETETGLFVCLSSFIGLGKKFVERYYKKTGNNVFLCLKRRKVEIPQEEEPAPEKAPTKLAIGVEGGFSVDQKKFDYVDQNSIVILPDWTEIPLPNADIPDLAQLSVSSILVAEDLWKQEQAAALAGTWDGEKRVVSKHAANLVQLDNGRKIPPKGWKCEKCDLTTNLWLNLTDGSILCGRKFFDGTGGNNHAVEYYHEKRFPLAVKLGTITPDGADVFSYDEDDMVEDPNLAVHLAHFGINITSLEKTDKTMIELEIDINQKIGEWDVIQEAGSTLTPVYGPGYTGMKNLGNSCYMNSLMQVIFTIPDFNGKYFARYNDIIESTTTDPNSDFNLQMAKLAHGLISGEYSKSPPENISEHLLPPNGICPRTFRFLIGKGHPEFATKRQQDVQEFFLHLLNFIERSNRGCVNPTECFKYQVEDRVQCTQSNKVKYTNREDYLLALPVPMEAAVNKDEVTAYENKKKELESQGLRIDPKELVRPRISLTSCLECFAADEIVDDFYSSAIQSKSVAKKTTRLSTFPDYLMIQLKKFTIGSDWVPKKLDVAVDIPDELDISHLKGKGLQPGEEVLPEEQQSSQPEINIDETVVRQLAEMGFPVEACKKGVFYTNNSGIESAMNWVMEHLDDPDIASPLQVSKSSNSGFVPNDDALAMITAMGFTRDQATRALKETNNNVERAADWIFSHQDELDVPMETEPSTAGAPQSKFRDGAGKYKLVAFISHMGTSTMVGHYVCHILKEGRWVIYNDEKVALSEHPPKDLAYLYLYKRQ